MLSSQMIVDVRAQVTSGTEQSSTSIWHWL